MSGSGIPPAVRRFVWEREAGRCLRCYGACTNIHHRRPRMMGGTRDPRINDPRNLVALCGSGTTGCHGWIESHRELALAQGWLIASLDDLDRPVLILGREVHLGAYAARE